MTNSRNKIQGRTILITGGTGSFGHTVTRLLLSFKPKQIIIFSRDENKQYHMRNEFDTSLLRFVIGDVRDYQRVESTMKGVDYVFHAAALKHVPSCEFFPLEAVKTNILGTENVIQAAIKNKVKNLVVLSTDKAVYPINAMGISKAMMEKIMIAASQNLLAHKNNNTILCGVRYGNVLYTRGSVLPFFIKQIKENKKLSVTNVDMTRFLLPLDQAVDLVLYALVNGKNGHMYIRKSPATTLSILAEAVCELFDFQKGTKEVGVRAGEKIHETLISTEEFVRAQDKGNYYIIPPETQELDYSSYYSGGKKENSESLESFTSANTDQLDVNQTKKILRQVPEIKKELALMK